MPTRFTRFAFAPLLVISLVGEAAIAQTQPQQNPSPTQCGGLEQKDIKPFAEDAGEPIAVAVCDGHVYVGSIFEMKPKSFTLKTKENQFVQIDYASVTEIAIARAFFGPSRAEKIGQLIEHYLLLPFTILQCLLASCGS
jgi:hypothetical protein